MSARRCARSALTTLMRFPHSKAERSAHTVHVKAQDPPAYHDSADQRPCRIPQWQAYWNTLQVIAKPKLATCPCLNKAMAWTC